MVNLTRIPVLTATLLAIGAASVTAAPTPRYIAVDVGTLGGPSAAPNSPGRIVSNNGIVVGSADTPALDPFPGDPGCLFLTPCHTNDAFEWRKGVMVDLGTLGGYSAGIFELNGAGTGAGVSETGALDPLTGLPVAHAAMSSNGHLTDLGTLGGNESWAMGINDAGQIAGFASNTTSDAYAQDLSNIGVAPNPSATEWRATIWQAGKIKDLGTLGGPDSIGGLINERGQVAGESFTNPTVNAATGMPTLDPFIWSDGVMRDLGGLGGTSGIANWINSHGEVAGFSDLAGDQSGHPFLWDGKRMLDLGTLGGNNGGANWVNDAGEVVGSADSPGSQTHHGFVWRNGRMTDLPPTDGAPCSNANAIGDAGEVVGNDTNCQGDELNAVLWRNGIGYNLNDLIAPSPLHLITAEYVNPSGEIVTRALLPNGDNRVVLLVPRALAASEGLQASPVIAAAHDTRAGDHPMRSGRLHQRKAISRCASRRWAVEGNC